MSEEKFRVTIFVRVESAMRARDEHFLNVVLFSSVPFPPVEEGELKIKRWRKLQALLDENKIRQLAEAAYRWPIDPPVGLAGAIVEAEVEVTLTPPPANWIEPKSVQYEVLRFFAAPSFIAANSKLFSLGPDEQV